MRKLVFILVSIFFSFTLKAQILLTTSQVNAINSTQSAAEGDIYKDTENNIYYIGTSSGLLKIIGDISKVNSTLTGDGSVGNPLGIAPMGASNGQVLSWNGTTWVPVNAAPSTTTVSNNIVSGQLTTTVNGVSATAVTLPTADGSETKINNGTNTTVAGAGTVASPYTVSVADATTTAKGVVQLAGDLTGTATSPQIAANAVTTAEIANSTILNEDIADNTIASGKILDGTIATADLGNAQVTYAKIQNVAGQRLLGNPTASAAAPSEISLGTGLSFSGSVLNATNNGTVTTVTGTSPIVITGTPTSTPNVTITRNSIVTGTSSSSASNPLVLDAGATNAVVGSSNATFTVNNTAPLWNSNQLQTNPVSATAPTNGQVLTWNGSAWAPASSSTGWSLTGNAGTAPTTNFLGTTDAQRLVFRTNNTEKMTILSAGNVGIGIAAPDATIHNNGSSINTVRTITNKPTGGNIETAANSVDIGSSFAINQTTTGQTLTIPSPTVSTSGRMIKVSNIGTASFKISNIVLSPSKFADFLWTGTAWIPAVSEIAPSLTNKTYILSAEYAGAVLVAGSGTNHKGDMFGDNTGASSPYYMNYYEWKGRSSAGVQTYQVIVRITLPNDFTEWQATALSFNNMANSGCSVSINIYNVSTGASIYTGSALTNTTWTITSLTNANLSSWITPGQTAAMVITFSATNGNVARIGDIVLNYR